MGFYRYVLASSPGGTLYVGHTENLTVRLSQHRQQLRPGFTARYGVDQLVWFSHHDTRAGARAREQQLKKWNRAWKIRLIRAFNPGWQDLYEGFLSGEVEAWQGPLPDLRPVETE